MQKNDLVDNHLKQIKEKYFDLFSPQTIIFNNQLLEKARTMTLIFGGITAGILGLDGLQGLIFYFGLITFVSLVLAISLGFSAKPYFRSFGEAIGAGLTSNVLTYLLMWVMFYNLVYVL